MVNEACALTAAVRFWALGPKTGQAGFHPTEPIGVSKADARERSARFRPSAAYACKWLRPHKLTFRASPYVRTMLSARKSYGPFFVLIWSSLLAWSVTTCSVQRSAAETELRQTPEYQCLEEQSFRQPYVRWTAIRNLKSINSTYPVARLQNREGAKCIPDGASVSYVHVPVTAGSSRSLVRVPGGDVRVDYSRQDQWADLVSYDGSTRYRNDGQGYQLLPPGGLLPSQSY
ncbi:hypothetical protein GGQ76_004132 [Aureimonas jatrophae]|nr:hypothetical protein [Aureimonas jatrophae]